MTALVGEYTTPEALVRAIGEVRAMGLRGLDALSPYPVHEAEELLDLGRPRTPRWALLGGLAGAAGMYLLQLWVSAWHWPLDVGGRPPHSVPAFIPWTFEGGVLCASLSVFVAFFLACGLPRLSHPLFQVEGIERATQDRFFLVVDAQERGFDRQRVEAVLLGAGAVAVRPVEAA